ncbi:unnamed protein product [Pleuronectes platessa]|uniref:Uncharacterized protein n=1 Tax=Pleuronectes platessa TaxID=8262 RepID=A0A9N7VEF0_PLEPL|nr:unnamed protein product [Pleuronectes platessa]
MPISSSRIAASSLTMKPNLDADEAPVNARGPTKTCSVMHKQCLGVFISAYVCNGPSGPTGKAPCSTLPLPGRRSDEAAVTLKAVTTLSSQVESGENTELELKLLCQQQQGLSA